uniref:Uncharacterized protein n=1 Tax=Rhizophora mucronata TaxID=61149 RepID=A0A2P2PXZ2_RHIMU
MSHVANILLTEVSYPTCFNGWVIFKSEKEPRESTGYCKLNFISEVRHVKTQILLYFYKRECSFHI